MTGTTLHRVNIKYNLLSRTDDRQLTRKTVHINDLFFIIEMLCKDSYWLQSIFSV